MAPSSGGCSRRPVYGRGGHFDRERLP
jgi:hypothetical protein